MNEITKPPTDTHYYRFFFICSLIVAHFGFRTSHTIRTLFTALPQFVHNFWWWPTEQLSPLERLRTLRTVFCAKVTTNLYTSLCISCIMRIVHCTGQHLCCASLKSTAFQHSQQYDNARPRRFHRLFALRLRARALCISCIWSTHACIVYYAHSVIMLLAHF